jgi:hypothetical protein
MRYPRCGCVPVAIVFVLVTTAGARAETVVSQRSLRAASSEWRGPGERIGPNSTEFFGRNRPESTRARRVGERKDPRRDPVENGVLIGALSGALTGVVLTGLFSTQCNGRCDDPSLTTFGIATVSLGAGLGALAGFLIDRAR